MSQEKTLNVGPSRIEVTYERFGDPSAPPVLLVMGGGGQLIHWHEGFCAELVTRGCHVIRFDNRDAGLSSHFPDLPTPAPQTPPTTNPGTTPTANPRTPPTSDPRAVLTGDPQTVPAADPRTALPSYPQAASTANPRTPPAADPRAALTGDLPTAPYTLSDMAADTVGLLDALGLADAHLVGASMGGMIAQTVAIEHPARIRSLTSIMSSTGARDVGQADPEALATVIGDPPPMGRKKPEALATIMASPPPVGREKPETLATAMGSPPPIGREEAGALATAIANPPPIGREEAAERWVRASKVVGSPGYPDDEAETRELALLAYDRSYDPAGMARQSIAILASGDRTPLLRSLRLPTLVIHGSDDLLCDASGGKATAEAIPGAELVIIDGMGHNLPRALWPELASRISNFVHEVERS